jgi:hypothetical protein
MIIVLSPAKTLDFSKSINVNHTVPEFLNKSSKLIKVLKTKEPKDIASLMGLSDKLAVLNFDRYQSWNSSKTLSSESKPSLFVFQGDVYSGLKAEEFSKHEVAFAQKHLRILSGLYGVLRPLDVMKPYRLEMGTKLNIDNAKNLYEFWGDDLKNKILDELLNQRSDLLINLASVEYFKSLGKMPEHVTTVSPIFKDQKNGTYKIISFYAKKARGTMARWIIRNKVTDFEKLVEFADDGYYFSEKDSTLSEPVFLRD